MTCMRICKKEDSVQILGEQVEPWELLQRFSGGYAEISGSCRSCKKYKMSGDHKS